MKRILLSLVLVLAGAAIAQTKKKSAEPPKPTKNAVSASSSATKSSAPKLTTKEPSFAGFTGSFLEFGKVSGENRPFTMSIDYKPWFFEISGLANAGHNTGDLDILLEDIVTVLAYYDAVGNAPDGTNYQAALFDFMIYLDDEAIKVSNLKIDLKGKAEAGSSVLNQAKTWNFEQGKVFKTPKYSNSIIKAQASAMDKSDIAREKAAAKKRVADSIAREKQRVADSIAKEEQRVADSIARIKKQIAKEKKRIADSIAEAEAEAEVLRREEKRKAAAAKKRKAAIQEEEDEDDEPPVRKKAPPKKKPTFTVEEDEDDAPPPPKKKKRVAD